MPSRRRKKPPDPPSASLLSFSCRNHALSPDPIYPYPCNLSLSLGLGNRVRNTAVSRPLPSRSRTEEYTVFRSSSIPTICVTTTSTVGYRSTAVSCSSAWQRSLGCSSSRFCLMLKVRTVRLLRTKMSQRLFSDRYGKSFGCAYPASSSSAVWSFYSLSSWVPLLPEIAVLILWGRTCLCSVWGFLFKVSFSCFVPLVGRCSCRHGVSCVFHVSSGLAVLHIYSTSLSLTVSYWGFLGSVCFGYARDYDGFSAFVSFELLFPLIFLTISWMRLPWLWVNLWTLMYLIEAKLIVTYCLLAISYTDFALCPSLSCAQSTPLIMLGCVDKVHGSHPSTTKLCSWGHVYCTDPHGSLANIYLYPFKTCSHKPRASRSLMRFFTEHSEACFVYSDNWAHPSLLLSLLLVILHAQIHDFQCYWFCAPLVYEERFSEAKAYCIMHLGLFPVFRYTLWWCHLSFFQYDWDVNRGQWPFIYEAMFNKIWFSAVVDFPRVLITFDWSVVPGTRSLPSCILLKLAVKLQAYIRGIGVQDQVLDTYTIMLWADPDMYWFYMIDFFLVQLVIDKAVSWLSEIFSYLLCNCSHWSVWFVAQHCYVLGPCHTALE